MLNIDTFIEKLGELCQDSNIDDSHGLMHARTVMANAIRAMEYDDTINEREKYMIQVAALLHDADDAKYFPNNNEYQNARSIIQHTPVFSMEEVEVIIKMISLVSTSKNKDTVPSDIPQWMLYPRYADRLEAIGIIGVERTLEFTLKKNQPLFLESTLKARTVEELKTIATTERYQQYESKSVSMFDHLYDKLLHLGNFPIRNEYFDSECTKRMQPLIDLALEFGNSDNGMTADKVKKFIEKC